LKCVALFLAILFSLAVPCLIRAQAVAVPGGANTLFSTGVPAGACASGAIDTDNTTGIIYSCKFGVWVVGSGGPGTIAGTIANTQVAVGSAANTIGGSSALTFAGNLLDIKNGGTGSVTSPLTIQGSGAGSFDPAAQVALVNIEQESAALAPLGLVVTNRVANVAKGAADSLLNMQISDAGLALFCGGGAVSDANNNYTCFSWDALSGISVTQTTSIGTNSTRVPFTIVGSTGATGNLLNFKSTIGGPVVSFFDINGNYSAGTDNSLAGIVTLANSAANAHTIFVSGATTTNTIAGFTAVPTTGDVVTCTVVATTCTLTDGGAPGGAPAFSAITGATNTTAAMICGTGCSLSSVPQFNVGAVGTSGILGLKGTTSGTATLTAPAVAGTTTNPIVSSNNIQVPVGAVTTPGLGIGAGGSGIFSVGGGVTLEVTGVSQLAAFTNSVRVLPTAALGFASGSLDTNALDTAISRDSAGVMDVGNGTASDVTGTIKPGKYATGTNCNSSASPAVCGSAAAGMFTLAATTTSVTVNTTAVTANSEIIVFNDDSLGARLGVTCNTGIDSVLVSARVAATSFTVTGSAPVTNPNCYSYLIMN